MSTPSVIFEAINIILVMGVVIFTYFRFFREGTHRQRIELDIEFNDLGKKKDDRIIEIGVVVENKGNVDHKVDGIRLRIRGLDNNTCLSELEGHKPRLVFPKDLGKINLVPSGKYFVRPNVKQRFSVVIRIPGDWTHMLARSTFKYDGDVGVHDTERGFLIE